MAHQQIIQLKPEEFMQSQLRANETVLFEGDVTLIKSRLSVTPTLAMVTNQRLAVADGKLFVEKADITSAVEEKHGFTSKILFSLRNGEKLALTAANHGGFKSAVMILTGQAEASSLAAAPPLSQAHKGTAWLAAFSPLIAAFLAGVIALMFWGNPEQWGWSTLFQVFLLRFALLWLFLRIDYLMLQKQGYAVKQLGLADPLTLPFYLFSRAKVFGHSKVYGITWCVIVAIDLLLVFA